METILFAANSFLHVALALSVLGIAGAVFIAGLYEVARNKVQGLWRRDEIVLEIDAVASVGAVPQHS